MSLQSFLYRIMELLVSTWSPHSFFAMLRSFCSWNISIAVDVGGTWIVENVEKNENRLYGMFFQEVH